MAKLIDSISTGVPKALDEVITLGRTLKKRAADMLAAYFDRPGTSNGPTEAINGRLEHLRGSALGFRNGRQGRRGGWAMKEAARLVATSSMVELWRLSRLDESFRIRSVIVGGQ